MISLAKRLEEVYVPGRSAPLPIRADSEASRLLQRVRDEAHRFALDLHRKRRGKAMTGSVLDGLRGVGPARKRALLSHFGSPERFLDASRGGDRGGPGHPRQAGPRHPPAAQQGRLTHRSPTFIIRAPCPKPVISVRGLRKSYGELEAVRGIDLEVRARRDLRLPRPQRGRQDDDDLGPRGLSRSRRAARSRCSARTRPTAGRDWRGRVGFVLQECRMEPLLTVRETLEMYAGYYRAAAVGRRDDRAGRARREGRRPRRQALRRPAAPPRRRRRADRRRRAALPRRADDRVRPLGPPRGLAGDRGAPRPRQDRAADDPLHGRGAGARRPGRRDRRAARSSPPARPTTSAAAATPPA